MATYNRDGAISYAKKWWDGHNPAYANFDNMDSDNSDCANFVSQCMHEGGGMPMKFTGGKFTTWYFRAMGDCSSSWSGAQSLRLFVKNNKTEVPRMPYSFLSNSQVGTLTKGDLVFHLEGSGDKSLREADHVAMVDHVEGNTIYVYQHSSPKGNQAWAYALKDTILCHFSGSIITDGSGGGDSGDTSGWSARYGTALLKKSNSYNAYVKNLQTDLIELGYNVGKAGADGYYGDDTVSAVTAFQKANGLGADGLAGDKTKQKLYDLVFNKN